MRIGYCRVSTNSQNLDRQVAALRTEECDKIYREKASGKSLKGRPQLDKAVDALGTDDVLIVAEWDRATRSMQDGLNIMQRVADRGALVKVLDKPFLDLTTPMGKGILAFMSALAEDERERIIRRAAEGREIARGKNVKFGRKPILSAGQQQVVRDRLASGESCRQIAKDFRVSPATISRITV
ncbi:recombinase family protein [Lentilitoribacter sp. Alg239-R112]|uniref:recombinase family protein n=1 Tax=Lentilitoribacter sp. Alg239-R112 TaxID=2305987 RepID=UPI0013A6D1C4|nr:recombinase family protein [Lentilitoribacter sp. Alg239-R112]